jgi:hypothetical protein
METPKSENIFRQEYRDLSDDEKKSLDTIKDKANELLSYFPREENMKPINREVSLAITKLEEAVMWVVKGITK